MWAPCIDKHNRTFSTALLAAIPTESLDLHLSPVPKRKWTDCCIIQSGMELGSCANKRNYRHSKPGPNYLLYFNSINPKAASDDLAGISSENGTPTPRNTPAHCHFTCGVWQNVGWQDKSCMIEQVGSLELTISPHPVRIYRTHSRQTNYFEQMACLSLLGLWSTQN